MNPWEIVGWMAAGVVGLFLVVIAVLVVMAGVQSVVSAVRKMRMER